MKSLLFQKNSLFSLSRRQFGHKVMKAIICDGFGEVDVMKVESVPVPECKDNEVLLQVEATAVNRADILQRRGKYPPPPGVTDILGLECVGYITDPKTMTPDKSQRYLALLSGGSYAQYVKVNRHHIIPAPKGLSLEQVAAIPEVWITAYQLLHVVAQAKFNETALILAAASGVGTSLIQLCKYHKVKTIAVASTHEKLKTCRDLGADHVISYKETQDYSQLVKEYTKGKGVDIIMDPILASNFEYNMNSIGLDSRWVMYGTMGGLKVKEANFTKLILNRGSILVSTLRSRSDIYKAMLVKSFEENCIKAFEEGELVPIVDSVLKLKEVKKAHQLMESNANVGKIVLINDL